MALFNEVCEGTTGFVGTQDTTFIPNLFSFFGEVHYDSRTVQKAFFDPDDTGTTLSEP